MEEISVAISNEQAGQSSSAVSEADASVAISSEYEQQSSSSGRMLALQRHLEEKVQLMQRRLEEMAGSGGSGSGDTTASLSIFRFPLNLTGIMDDTAHLPQLVSIGPYHRGEDHLQQFEKYKWYYLERHLSFRKVQLRKYFIRLEPHVQQANEYYSGTPTMSSEDFIEMMILDSCFVVYFLMGLECKPGELPDRFHENDPISAMPSLIPILITDLLKLENQIPFFILECFWPTRIGQSLQFIALQVFKMLFPMPLRSTAHEPKHLLDLLHRCFCRSSQNIPGSSRPHVPSLQSIQCAGKLSHSGLKFSSKKADSFLDIKLRGRALMIPSTTINDWTGTIILNCVALEQQSLGHSTHFSSYVVFMKSLISEPKDVALLCSNNIITSTSKNDQFVVNFFNKLGEKIDFNLRDCYLSEEFSQLEAFYSSLFPTIRRQYFSSPLASIVTFYAPTLLILTVAQLILQVLQYRQPSKH